MKNLFSNVVGEYSLSDFQDKVVVHAKTQHTRFGWSLDYLNGVTYIGEPHYIMREGAVHIVSSNNSTCYTFSRKGSYFGRKVLMTQYGLMVSAPSENIPLEHTGAVYLFKSL